MSASGLCYFVAGIAATITTTIVVVGLWTHNPYVVMALPSGLMTWGLLSMGSKADE